jgi:hypothetical protein
MPTPFLVDSMLAQDQEARNVHPALMSWVHREDGRPRTFASRLRYRGIPLEDVQRPGRWSSPTMLLQVYSASPEERLRAAADATRDALTSI